MPVYHSNFKKTEYKKACNLSLIPILNKKEPCMDLKLIKECSEQVDIIDESIFYFRPNSFFNNFKLESDGDKILVYTSVFIAKCLNSLNDHRSDLKKCKEILNNLVAECEWGFSLKTHFLNSFLTNIQDEAIELSKYLKLVREQTASRLFYLLFESPGCELDVKYWFGFYRVKFLGFEMQQVKRF